MQLLFGILLIFIYHKEISSVIHNNVPDICPNIISKTRWGARSPLEVAYALIPVQYVVVHHTVTPNCYSEEECSSMLRNIQTFHMEDMGFHDIGYNFMVGGDGQIYEGAGWHKIGAHAKGYNSRGLGLAFIGNFTTKLPSDKQMKIARNFLQCGVLLKELSTDYKLFGARSVISTLSPGLRLFRELHNWPHFTTSP